MSAASITVIDVLVVAVILISAGFAAWRGLVSETFTIIDWVVAAFVALRVTPMFQPLLREVISPPWLEYIVVFIGTFLLLFIPLSILNHRVSEMVQKSEIAPVDRIMGFIFGAGRGLVIVGIAYIAFSALVPPQDQPASLSRARLFPVIQQTSDVLLNLAPSRGANAAPAAARAVAARTAPAAAPEKPDAAASEGGLAGKTYGADERSALDRLIETTGAPGPSK